MTPISTVSEDPRAATITSANIRCGIEMNVSDVREISASVQPPRTAARMPRNVPAAEASMVASSEAPSV